MFDAAVSALSNPSWPVRQSLTIAGFEALAREIGAVAAAVDRGLWAGNPKGKKKVSEAVLSRNVS